VCFRLSTLPTHCLVCPPTVLLHPPPVSGCGQFCLGLLRASWSRDRCSGHRPGIAGMSVACSCDRRRGVCGEIMLADDAIPQCILAVRNCVGREEPGLDIGNMDEGELPRWHRVPKYCRFRIEKLGARGGRRPTAEEKRKQCCEYMKFRNWAFRACGVTEPELERHLKAAAFTPQDRLGAANLPRAVRRAHLSPPSLFPLAFGSRSSLSPRSPPSSPLIIIIII